MTDHLLLVSIGPIQDFIASARKAQDLWFGSWLLSDLARAVADQFPAPSTVVFPGRLEAENVANKILVRVEGDPGEAASRARAALETRLTGLATALFNRALERAGDLGEHFDMKTALAQVADLIEFLWAAVPITDTNYVSARQEVEKLLAARKNTRTWRAVDWGQGVPKSALDGQRESVLHERLFDRIRTNPALGERARRAFGIRPAERLCGVGLLKRLGQEVGDEAGGEVEAKVFGHRSRPTFHSTSHSAALQLIAPFRASATVGWKAYLEQLGRDDALGRAGLQRFALRAGTQDITSFDGYDGSLLFEERVRLALEERMPREQARARLAALQNARQDVLRSCGVSEPPAYYALLLADGDRMGAAIDAQTSMAGHRRLSAALDEFAASVEDIVCDDHDGSLIYAGGDDVLALLPLHTAVECARDLADEFARKLSAFSSPAGTPTLSVGIAVGHHLTHFALVREQAQRAERAAKAFNASSGNNAKNALALSIDKRAGGETVVVGSWSAVDGLAPIDRRLRRWARLFHEAEMPHGVLHELEALARLGDNGGDAMKPLLQAETRRILLRKQPGAGAKEFKREVREELERRINNQKNPGDALRALADELYVALELHRALRTASPDGTLTTQLTEDPWEPSTPAGSALEEVQQ